MHITTSDEALRIVDTEIRQSWLQAFQGSEFCGAIESGQVYVYEEGDFNGGKAWHYHIDGLPLSRDGRKRWLLDTGETVETTLDEDENTIEKAYVKQQRLIEEYRRQQAEQQG